MRADRPLPPYACPARRGLQRRRRGIERGSSDLASRTEEGSARAGASRTRRRDKLFSHKRTTSSFHSANKCEQLHEYLITLVSYSAQVLRAPICPRHASCTGLF